MGKRLYIGNLSFNATESDLREHFQDLGTVTYCKVIKDPEGKSRGFGFIELQEEQALDDALALEGTMFMGRELHVQLAKETTRNERSQGRGPRDDDRNGNGNRRFSRERR